MISCNDGINIVDSGISDQDETHGKERDFAITSPPKHGQHVSCKVCHSLFLIWWIFLSFVSGPDKSGEFTTTEDQPSCHHQEAHQ